MLSGTTDSRAGVARSQDLVPLALREDGGHSNATHIMDHTREDDAVPETTIEELLFQLPSMPLTREERIRLIKEALTNEKEITQEGLDQVMARLLEEIQSDT